jgi:hypothetical protein
MQFKTKFLPAIAILAGFILMSTFSGLDNAMASSDPQNGFGKAASECAKEKSCPTSDGEGSMGEHSKAGDAAGDPPFNSGGGDKNGRLGIGNVAKALCDSDSVSDLGNFLSGKSDNC